MASEIDICNLALAHLGDTATVSSINPPDPSAQAQHCARFYPIARDALLEKHSWGFATKRQPLALLGTAVDGTAPTEWAYSYALPSDAINILAVLPSDAVDDYSTGLNYGNMLQAQGGNYIPQPFDCETDAEGRGVVYTDQENAMLRYTGVVSDTARFSPLFVLALSWNLASMLAGSIIKGDAGAAEAKRCIGMLQQVLDSAVDSDAGQRRVQPTHNVAWMAGR